MAFANKNPIATRRNNCAGDQNQKAALYELVDVGSSKHPLWVYGIPQCPENVGHARFCTKLVADAKFFKTRLTTKRRQKITKTAITSVTIMNRAQMKIEEDEDNTPLMTLWRMERLLNQMKTIG